MLRPATSADSCLLDVPQDLGQLDAECLGNVEVAQDPAIRLSTLQARVGGDRHLAVERDFVLLQVAASTLGADVGPDQTEAALVIGSSLWLLSHTVTSLVANDDRTKIGY